MTKSTWRRSAIALIAIAIIVSSCSLGASTGSPSPQQSSTPSAAASKVALTASSNCTPQQPRKLTLSIGSTGFLYLPMFVAVGGGFTKDAGVDLDIQNLGGQYQAAFLAGSVDLDDGALANIAALRNQGRDVVAVGGTVNQIAQFMVIKKAAAAKAGIDASTPFTDKVKRMKGMTIGVFTPGTSADNYTRSMMKDVGMNPDTDAKIVYLQDEGSISAAFQTNKIDAFMASAPLATVAVQKQDGMIVISFPDGDYGRLKNAQQMVYTARADWLAAPEHRAAVGCLLVATQRALDLISSDPAKALQAAKSSFGNLDDATYQLGFQQTQKAYSKSIRVSPQSATVTLEFERLFKPLKDPIEKHFDNSIVDEYLGTK